MNRILIFLLLILVSGPSLSFAEEPIRVLFIGNSYTYRNHMPRMFMKIAKANGKQLIGALKEKPRSTDTPCERKCIKPSNGRNGITWCCKAPVEIC